MTILTRAALAAALLCILAGVCFAADTMHDPRLPNAKETPGAVSPIVHQENLAHTVCVKGYTERIRPPGSYTDFVKRRQLGGQLSKGVYKSTLLKASFEEDHLVPLCGGGHPTSLANLWPQGMGRETKDVCERRACVALCKGTIPLDKLQKGFAHNWVKFCAGLT